jgi:hypothetical protein
MRKKIFLIFVAVVFASAALQAQTWLASKRLTWNSGDSDAPGTTTDSNNHIYVVWHDDTPTDNEIFFRKSTDGGAAWAGTKRLTWNSGSSENPEAATDSNNHIHVVWQDSTPGNDEIFYRRSTDGGSTWTSAKRVTWNSGSSYEPAITIDANNHIHVIWYDDTPVYAEIYYTKSTNGGSSWSTKRLTWVPAYSYLPDITTDTNNNIYVVWADRRKGNYEIYFKKSTDAGATWWTCKRLTWTSENSGVPAVTTDSNNNIFVAYTDLTPGVNEVFLKKSTDGGINWTSDRLTWTAGSSGNPTVASDTNNNIHVIWQDSTYGTDDLFHKRSTNGGSSWTTKRLTWNPNLSFWPDIAIDSMNRIHIVWKYGSVHVGEIYYKRGNQ